jgi:hypothetical protein
MNMDGLQQRLATELAYPIAQADSLLGFSASTRLKQHPEDAQLALAIGLATARVP